MPKNYDIAVIGAGIMGMSAAYYLSRSGQKLAVVDKAYIGSGSTGRCIAGIRHQFSTPTSIGIMKENVALFSQMEEEFGFSVEFYQGGYLLLAHTPEMVDIFKSNIAVQKNEGVNVSLLSAEEAKSVVPKLNIDGLLAAAFCPDDGQASPFAVMKGYKESIEKNDGEFFLHNPVQKFVKETNFILTLEDGTVIETEKALLCAGPWTKELGENVGLDLPMFPERHEAVITERVQRMIEPMIVDYRKDGCYFQQLLTGQIIGCFTPYPNVPGTNKDSSREFLLEIGKRMVRLVPELENTAILRHWAGSYNMTPDGNPIVDKTPVDNLYISSGMCGHGFMFGPSLSKHLAHFMLHGEWEIDFSEFAFDRSFEGHESLK